MNEDTGFIEAIKQGDLDLIRSFPKSDLHNHFVLGGSREYIFSKTGYEIEPVTGTLNSMNEMDAWSAKYIGNRFNTPEGRKLLIEATFEQAKRDGVTVLDQRNADHVVEEGELRDLLLAHNLGDDKKKKET